MNQGAWILLVAVALACAFGGYRMVRDGKFRPARRESPAEASVLAGTPHELGDRATLLQFSSAFCAPCRATRVVLAEVAAGLPGVAHVEVDAEANLELVRRLGIQRTPTTLVLDQHGREVTRAAGAPRKQEVLAALARLG